MVLFIVMIWKRKNYAWVVFCFILFSRDFVWVCVCLIEDLWFFLFCGFFWLDVNLFFFFLLVAKNPPRCCCVVVGSKGMEWKEISFGE